MAQAQIVPILILFVIYLLPDCAQEVKGFSTVEELETFLLKHGESIVDLMGGEIDRIELKLRVKYTIFH